MPMISKKRSTKRSVYSRTLVPLCDICRYHVIGVYVYVCRECETFICKHCMKHWMERNGERVCPVCCEDYGFDPFMNLVHLFRMQSCE